jgi:hypothetical protein
MSDNLKIRQPADAQRVNVNESWEVEYWTKKFGCSEAQLRAAVKAVGVMANDVQRYLQKR